jgi:hypothetical protein
VEVAGGCRRLHNEELRNLYAPQNIITMIELRRMRWTGHVTRVVEMKIHIKFWSKNLKGRDHSEDLGEDGKDILK